MENGWRGFNTFRAAKHVCEGDFKVDQAGFASVSFMCWKAYLLCVLRFFFRECCVPAIVICQGGLLTFSSITLCLFLTSKSVVVVANSVL